MSKAALQAFLAEQVAAAKAEDVLFCVHLKATMMKVSDPIIFGHVVRAFFADVFSTYGEELASVGANPNDGLASVLSALDKLPAERRAEIEGAITATYQSGPALAQVDSSKGITNLHVPSDVIIDASMPAAIRSSGQMWNADDQQQDTLYVIPDSSYAPLYAETVDFCRRHGAFDPTTMGTTPNVGLMAQKAEEYGSHDKTFEIATAGTVNVVASDGSVLLSQQVERRRHLPGLPDQGRADHRLGAARGVPRARDRRTRRVLARREPGARRRGAQEGARGPADARHRRPDPGVPRRRRRDPVHPRAGGQGRGHHQRHRQRAARLPHRPVPDPRARDRPPRCSRSCR